MSALQAEVDEAFRVLDVPGDKAFRAAVALSAPLTKVEDETSRSFSKRNADVEAIRKDISTISWEVAGINTRPAVMQGETNSPVARMDGHIIALDGSFISPMTSLEGNVGHRIGAFESSFDSRITALEGSLNGRMAAMQGEINLLKWMMGAVIALLATVLFRVFTH